MKQSNEHDDKLSALYRAHLAGTQIPAAVPSAASDASVLKLARDAVLASAASKTIVKQEKKAGWSAWLSKSWFGPGLAFATIASLSVVVVALMPKEELSIEREVASSSPGDSKKSVAAGGPTQDAKRESSTIASSVPRAETEPGPVTLPMTERDPAKPLPATTTSLSNAAAARTRAPAPTPPRAKTAADASFQERADRNPLASGASGASGGSGGSGSSARTRAPDPFPAAPSRSAIVSQSASRTESQPASQAASQPAPRSVPQPAAPLPAPSANAYRDERGLTRSAAAPAPAIVPAVSPAAAAPSPPSPPSPPSAAPAPVADAPRYEKPSLLTESTESRLQNHAGAEVPDSAPTYPNEARSSIPLPYTYTMPRKSREASATGALAGSAMAPAATAPGRGATAQLAAAQPRDPVEWVKAIQKLKTENKMDAVLKELADFRKQHPQYVLPDELRNLK